MERLSLLNSQRLGLHICAWLPDGAAKGRAYLDIWANASILTLKVPFIYSPVHITKRFSCILPLPILLLPDALACTRSKLPPATYCTTKWPLSFGRQYFFVPVPGYNTIVPVRPIAPTILVHAYSIRESASTNRSFSSQGPISFRYYLIKLRRVIGKEATTKKIPFEYLLQFLLHDIFPQTVSTFA